jgi:hypothetical protein
MRVNMCKTHQTRYPIWVEMLINDYIEQFKKEYDVDSIEAYRYFFDVENLNRIKDLFKDRGIDVEVYDVEGLSSKGIIIPEDDPTVVLYKLRYSDQSS